LFTSNIAAFDILWYGATDAPEEINPCLLLYRAGLVARNKSLHPFISPSEASWAKSSGRSVNDWQNVESRQPVWW